VFYLSGQQFRPFIKNAEITTRCYSRPLQRVMTDFGSDHAFGQVPHKLKEHYGIEAPVSTVRHITEHHANKMHEQRAMKSLPSKVAGCSELIAEIDGCMLPIVTIGDAKGDKRKQKKMSWQEARLALAHEKGAVTPVFSATFGNGVEEAGKALVDCAITAGFGTQTHVHGLGDGAFWIEEQFKAQFGSQASYLVDFYHVCDYLANASKVCAPSETKAWIETQKNLLKNNEHWVVIQNLTPYLEATEIASDKAPVRACHRYLSNRTQQLDYKNAIEKGFPIGSGEIESAHRYVIQKRLKLAGAWWKTENIQPMLTLRIVRANGEWNGYWKNVPEATEYNVSGILSHF
jgi:hypothetical protein